jgi:serine/threonine protein kinase
MLTDFGYATDNPTILYDRPGTVPYLAPEQVEGKTHGRAVDYWSYGIVGLELTLRRAIFSRIMPGRDLTNYQNSLGNSDSPLARCARAMLEVNPDSRMTAAEALPFFKNLQESRVSNKRRIGTR